MANFKDKFIRLLEQDQTATPVDLAAREAMAGTLDPGVQAKQYDVPAPRGDLGTEQKQQQLEELKGWITKIEEFATFLNAATPESMQSKLHAAHCNSLFETIAGSEKNKITRIAAECGSFAQTLNGYLISSNT